MYQIDYHTHSGYSPDSSAELEAVVESAISAELNELAVTDHFDPCLADASCREYKPSSYFDEISALREKYKDKIKILSGVEIGQAHIYYESCKKLLDTYPYDYVIGSLHNISGDIDVAFLDYEKTDVNSLLIQYFKELKLVAKTDCYDCLGHLDYPKRYIFKHKLRYSASDYFDAIKCILKTVIENGKGIEINTSGYNYYPAYTMPSMDVLKIYHSLGGEIITTGSDAHIPKNVGKKISYAMNTLKAVGFKYITVYRNRKPEFIKID